MRGMVNYYKSLSMELTSSYNRVRQLIGTAHHYHEGAYKESLIRDVLNKHTPVTVECKTGFVVSRQTGKCSREQDILIIDKRHYMPLFENEEIVITYPEAVLGVVSIKSLYDSGKLKDSIECMLSCIDTFSFGSNVGDILMSSFFFNKNEPELGSVKLRNISTHLKSSLDAVRPRDYFDNWKTPYLMNVALHSGSFFHVEDPFSEIMRGENITVSGYKMGDLLVAYFLSQITNHVTSRLGMDSHDNMLDFIEVDRIDTK